MANVTIAASNEANNTNVFTKPTGVVNGSVLVIRYCWFSTNNADPTAPSGFSELALVRTLQANAVSYQGIAIYRKVVTDSGSEPSDYTVGRPAGGGGTADFGEIDRLADCDTTTPETDTGTNSGDSGTLTTGDSVDSGAEDLLLLAGITDGISLGTPTGMTQDFELDGGDTEGWSENPGSLSAAARTSTLGSSVKWDTAWCVMKAAGGGGGDPDGRLVGGKLVGGGLLISGVLA